MTGVAHYVSVSLDIIALLERNDLWVTPYQSLVAVTAAVVRTCGEDLVTPLFVAAGAKTMECLLCIANPCFSVALQIGVCLPDPGDAEIHGLVASVAAAYPLARRAHHVMTGGAVHIFAVTVTLVRKSNRTELRGQGNHGHFGRDCVSRSHEHRCEPKEEERDPWQPAIRGG